MLISHVLKASLFYKGMMNDIKQEANMTRRHLSYISPVSTHTQWSRQKAYRFAAYCISVSLYCIAGFTHAEQAPRLLPTLQPQSLIVDGKTVIANVPTGYQLELLTTQISQPRFLTFDNNGDLFVGSQSGYVYRLPPPYTSPQKLMPRFRYPHSVALRGAKVFIASTEGVYQADRVNGKQLVNVQRIADLPAGNGHSSRTVKVGADDRLYVSLGISGNCSNQFMGAGYAFDQQRGGVFVLDEQRKSPRLMPFSTGLRNPVGFAWDQKGSMFATNNGPDHWGYDLPKEQFAPLSEGSFHGMPWYQVIDGRVTKDVCRSNESPVAIDSVTLPVASFPARSAPMAVEFISPNHSDSRLAGNAIVALHGSWAMKAGEGVASRRPPKVVVVMFNDAPQIRVVDWVTGFQGADGRRWSRPVGVAINTQGHIYFSSDGPVSAIYRLVPEKVK